MGEEPFAEVYEKLKELRRRGEFSELDVIHPQLTDKLRVLINAMVESNEALEKLDGSLVRILEIRTLADRVFGDGKKAAAWLNRNNPGFSGQKPIDLLTDELGTAVVREALEQIDHGIFA